MSVTLGEMVRKHALENPESLSLGSKTGYYTYRELDDKINRLAQAFVKKGIQPGDRIGILLMNRQEFVFTYYAAMRAGAISVPVNPVLSPRELQVILSDCQPKIIVSSQSLLDKLEQVTLNENPLVLNVDDSDSFHAFLYSGDETPYYAPVVPEDATIIYTSGTTGMPKGAVLTHHNLLSNAQSFANTLSFTANEKTLIVAPVFHSAAQTCCLNATIYSGGSNYLLERWESTTKTLQTMEREKITFFFGPPTMYTYMLQDPKLAEYNLSLRIALTGASPLPVKIYNQWKEFFDVEIVEAYGLSEASPVVTLSPPFGIKIPGSVGIPLQDVEVKIVDHEDQEVLAGEVGEVVVKGPNVMKGYWKKPEETEKAIRDGWLHTGDMARKDESGYFYIVDRKKDMINRSGFKIYPREVEEVLYQFPAIFEVAVIGVPNPEKGEEVKACITVKEGYTVPTLEDLRIFCTDKLASYKIPKILQVLDHMPKTVSGKILKTQLREH